MKRVVEHFDVIRKCKWCVYYCYMFFHLAFVSKLAHSLKHGPTEDGNPLTVRNDELTHLAQRKAFQQVLQVGLSFLLPCRS